MLIEKAESPHIISIGTIDCTCWEKYGNLIQSITITSLDIFFLLGSIFSSFPKIVTDSAFSCLNFAGLLSWSFYIDQTKKNVEDLSFSIKKNNNLMTGTAFLKTIFIITSIGLIAFNCCAATFRLINYPEITHKIYTLIRPFGLPSLGLSVVIDLLSFYIARKTLHFHLENKDLSQFYKTLTIKSLSKNKLDLYASYVRGCLDKDTWKHFIKHLPFANQNNRKQEELYNQVLIPNIYTQQTVVVSNLFLRLLGELGMYFSIVFPGTTIQAACWTVLSSLYTSQLVYQHYNQYKHRKLTSVITLT